jgi:hypothetical protein
MDKDNIISPERYIFWLNDITRLYKNDQYIKFFPTSDMTRIEQFNALSRFCIYLLILFIILDKKDEWLYIPIIGLIMIIILYNLFESDEDGKRKELLRMKRKIASKVIDEPDINYRTYLINEDGESRFIDIDQQIEEDAGSGENISSASVDYDLEAGYYDSNGKLVYGSNYSALSINKKKEEADKIKYTLDEMRIYQKAKARKPTTDNPFMNPTLNDFNKEMVPVAANADDEDIQNEIEYKFNEDLYRDIEDVFNKKNSQRQFFTVPHNIPNDQEAFARWCYKFPATCKTDQQRCLRWQNLQIRYE